MQPPETDQIAAALTAHGDQRRAARRERRAASGCPGPGALALIVVHGPDDAEADHLTTCGRCRAFAVEEWTSDAGARRVEAFPAQVQASVRRIIDASGAVPAPAPDDVVIEFPRFVRLAAAAAASVDEEPGRTMTGPDRYRHRETGVIVARRAEGARQVRIDVTVPDASCTGVRLVQVQVISGGGATASTMASYLVPVVGREGDAQRQGRALIEDVHEWLETRVVLPFVDWSVLETLDHVVIERSVGAGLEHRSSVDGWNRLADEMPADSEVRMLIRSVLGPKAT